jgi:thymidine phosphorylase
VRAGAPILTLHARHESRLQEAAALAEARLPLTLRLEA